MPALPVIAEPLSPLEIATLGRLERTIERGLESFLAVGAALLEIREQRLYRDRHKTFEAYCQTRWGMGRHQANDLIDAVRVVTNLVGAPTKTPPVAESSDSVPLPRSVRQAQPLARLPAAEQPEAWEEAVHKSNGKPTGKIVAEVVKERLAARETPRSSRGEAATRPAAAASAAAPSPPKAPPGRRPRPIVTDAERILDLAGQIRDLVRREVAAQYGENEHSRRALALLEQLVATIKTWSKLP